MTLPASDIGQTATGATTGQADSDPGAERRQPAGTQTLLRGLTLIECVAAGTNDVKGIAAHLDSPRSTVHRMLNSLVVEGYLHHIPYKGYLLGPKLIHLGMKALEQRPLVAVARPHIEALARLTGDTVHLGVMDGTEVFYLDKISGTRGLEMRSRIGQRMPVASTGVGRALMLGMPAGQWRDLYKAAVATTATTPDRPGPAPWPTYEKQMASYARQDWVYDFEENEIGVRCVGAPVRDISNRVVAAISVASASQFMSEERMAELGPVIRDAAHAVSRELGWTPPGGGFGAPGL
ncbi:IclR family transcriptional regulator [Azospirillum picis]|uniref:DNA-binding IclR family transcriptional regulator n=1 Tax=Azospirillum picis TaxID=488438 RepID=A0ABU0MJM6_9PROT|nr:IclR family transcriptional regulator [Azospirillum picis]MBP2299859.1 DNA-binding IclR family transcriptional regulator [Azospirillum picis]MDQ0533655.1 DNA-binding IclR family transcriptional regulator [Azospirillum picis]